MGDDNDRDDDDDEKLEPSRPDSSLQIENLHCYC